MYGLFIGNNRGCLSFMYVASQSALRTLASLWCFPNVIFVLSALYQMKHWLSSTLNVTLVLLLTSTYFILMPLCSLSAHCVVPLWPPCVLTLTTLCSHADYDMFPPLKIDLCSHIQHHDLSHWSPSVLTLNTITFHTDLHVFLHSAP